MHARGSAHNQKTKFFSHQMTPGASDRKHPFTTQNYTCKMASTSLEGYRKPGLTSASIFQPEESHDITSPNSPPRCTWSVSTDFTRNMVCTCEQSLHQKEHLHPQYKMVLPDSLWSIPMLFHLLVISMQRISTVAMEKLLLLSLQFL